MITVDWVTQVVSVPQSFLTLLSGDLYELDLDAFRLALKTIEYNEGMPYQDIHSHTAGVTISGVTGPLAVEIINGYTVTFEDLPYKVTTTGGNTNIADVLNLNQVQLITNNSFGLSQGAGAQAVWDHVLEGGFDAAEFMRIMASVLAGKVSGAGSGVETFKGLDGTTDRVVSTNDASGNRTAVTHDGT